MTSLSVPHSNDEIAELRAQIERLTQQVAGRSPSRRAWPWRRPLASASIAVLTVGMLAGIAGASGSTTDVTFVPLSPSKAVLSNASIATHKTSSPVVIGGTTTVPSDATAIRVVVSVKAPTSGSLSVYPTLNPGAGVQGLGYAGGNVVATATINANIGQSGELSFYNGGSGTAVVTATIIGYSTQVTAGDINGVGGSAGQVLTNDGSGGALWQKPATVKATALDGSDGIAGQVLTNNGSGGTAWQNHGQSYASQASKFVPASTPTTVDTLTVPAGSYLVSSAYDANASYAAFEDCTLRAPDGATNRYAYADINQAASPNNYYGSASTQMLLTTSGGTIELVCETSGSSSGATVEYESLIAVQVDRASGSAVVN